MSRAPAFDRGENPRRVVASSTLGPMSVPCALWIRRRRGKTAAPVCVAAADDGRRPEEASPSTAVRIGQTDDARLVSHSATPAGRGISPRDIPLSLTENIAMKSFFPVLCALLVALLGASSTYAAEYKKMTIRAATANPEGSLHVTAINKFKEIIEKESGGKITVQTFYGGSMGDEQANVKQLRNAEIHLAVLACGNLTPFAAQSGIFILPYMFPKMADAEKLFSNRTFMDKTADEIARQSRTRPLSWLIGGYRVITNSKKPVAKMEDLKGLKIRVPAVELQLEAFRSWGVEPSPLAWSETFNGLQQGVVDGQENPHAINRDQKFWEVQKYITDVHYMLWVGPMLVSEKWFRKLDPDTRTLVTEAARKAAAYEWQWSAEQDQLALKECLERGMLINEPENEQAWMEAARSVWPAFYDKVGGKSLVDEALGIMTR